MGGGCSCERNPNNVSDPTNNIANNEVEDQLAEFLELDHPLNVNKKYELFFEIHSNLSLNDYNIVFKRNNILVKVYEKLIVIFQR